MKTNRLIDSRWLWVALAVLTVGWFMLWLGHPPLVIQDEGRYVGVAREMLRHHEWVVPWFNQVPFFDKPIMYYWLEIIGLKVGGLTPFAARLPQMTMGVVGVMMTYYTCRRLFSSQVALLAWLFLSVSPLYFLLSHYADMDLEVAVFISLSLQFFILAQQPDCSKSARRYQMWLCYAAAGCAILTKGFMGIVFPAMVAGLWVVLTQQWLVFKRLHIIGGLVILLATNLPWDLAIQHRFDDYFHYFFYRLQFARYFAHNFSHIEPFWFYVPVLLVGVLPVSFLCLSRLAHWRALTIKHMKANRNTSFFLLWLVSIFVFFSVAHTKLIGYMIPVVPAIAVLSALGLQKTWQRQQRLPIFDCYAIVIGLFAISVTLFSLPLWMPDFAKVESAGMIYWLASFFLLGSVSCLYCYISQHHRTLIVSAVVVVMALNMVVLLCPAAQRTNKPMFDAAKPYLTPGTDVVMFYNYYYDAAFYLDRTFLLVNTWYKKIPDFQDSWQWRMQYGARQSGVQGGKLMINKQQLQKMWSSPKRLVVFLDQPSFKDLSALVSPKPVVVLKYYDHMVVVKPSMLSK